ncbi:zinc ribbon domain-containing protein, partial [Moorena sp. SIO3H5]|uniref:zinc ribbon domain-containing protein n=1 Tax=Moorena sp. SIO3H5 TaxID=2607834 RepID=UPI0013BCE7D9
IECFNCGALVEKNLAHRVHNCPNCGVKIDRDWNSGINILNRGLMAVGLPLNGCGKSIQDIEEQQVSFVNLRSPHHNL